VPPRPAAVHAEREQLFLLQAIAANDRYEGAQTIPNVSTASTVDIALPVSSAQVLFLWPRDATNAKGVVAIPEDKEK